MNNYEHTLVLKGDLPESQNEKVMGKYQTLINKNSGKVIKTENWGLRNLSYEINKNKKGFYFHIKLKGEGTTIEKLEEAENIDESVIRYLTIKIKKIDLDTNYFEKKEDQKVLGKDEKK